MKSLPSSDSSYFPIDTFPERYWIHTDFYPPFLFCLSQDKCHVFKWNRQALFTLLQIVQHFYWFTFSFMVALKKSFLATFSGLLNAQAGGECFVGWSYWWTLIIIFICGFIGYVPFYYMFVAFYLRVSSCPCTPSWLTIIKTHPF